MYFFQFKRFNLNSPSNRPIAKWNADHESHVPSAFFAKFFFFFARSSGHSGAELSVVRQIICLQWHRIKQIKINNNVLILLLLLFGALFAMCSS